MMGRRGTTMIMRSTTNRSSQRRPCCFSHAPLLKGVVLILLLIEASSAFSSADSKHTVLKIQNFSRGLLIRKSNTRADAADSSGSGATSSSPTTTVVESSNDDVQSTTSNTTKQLSQNAAYIQSLLRNLTNVLDRWIVNGSPLLQTQAHNILQQIRRQSMDEELSQQAVRKMKRAGMPLPAAVGSSNANDRKVELGKTDNASERREHAEARKAWEEQHQSTSEERLSANAGRSALSSRAARNGKPDLFLSSVDSRLQPQNFAEDKTALEQSLRQTSGKATPLTSGFTPSSISASLSSSTHTDSNSPLSQSTSTQQDPYVRSSELVALAGANNFDGEYMGIGGLDDVLAQVKRRIWVPLAAPPQLLQELGIHPVRGLLLYGIPGCGKTLLARTIGKILSPVRPVTVVSGPELMDKFVGSSEKNLREVFDNPPDIYDTFRLREADGGDSLASAALHVIIMDEFDAMARTRGGRDGKGDQGDAGVARDSVVNQLLAKMDGVDSLVVPTLVIGLTNKRSLIEAALLRPGRFEVQIEVPPPRTMEQRVSILKVHTKQMYEAGRLLVRDAPAGTPSSSHVELHKGSQTLLSYHELLDRLATECDGMSGASLAGVARAAASHALERAVVEFSTTVAEAHPVLNCLVTQEDFEGAVEDVFESSGDTDRQETIVDEEEPRKKVPEEGNR